MSQDKWTRLARGQMCMVRLSCCNHNSETVVLAHYRMSGTCGIGIKPPSLLGAYACFDCHQVIDGRRTIEGYTKTELRLSHAEGVMRTLYALIKQGKIK